MNFVSKLCLLALVAGMSACGGGGGNPGGTTGNTSPGTTTPTTTISTVSDFILQLDKASVTNSGSDKAQLSVVVLDGNRNVVAETPVAVSVDSDAVFTPASSQTDTSGKFTGDITIGSNKSNRIINATVTVGKLTKVVSIEVTGSQISLTPVPAVPLPGQAVSLNISTRDSAGGPISFVPVSISGSAGVSGSLNTDFSGNIVVGFVAPANPGTYTVVVSGLGVSTTKIIDVVAGGVSGKPVVTASVSSVSLSPVPTSIKTNPVGSTINRAKLQAKFLSASNAGIADMRVRFEILPPALGSGEAISTGDATVYSDGSGLAEADYIAGTRSSPTNGVVVRACYSKSDFTSPTDCPFQVTSTLTVSGDPLSITISDNNKLQVGLGGIAYIKQFLIQVNDAGGFAKEGAIVTPSVDITHFGKGVFGGIYPYGSIAPTIADPSLASAISVGTATTVISSITAAPSILQGSFTYNVWCQNEDRNRNGSLDAGEDVNGNGIIEPRKAEVIVSFVDGNKTDAKGQMLIQVSYGQNVAGWLAYTLRATTSVAGSEGDASKSYITDALQADVANGSFLTPPYGRLACNNRN